MLHFGLSEAGVANIRRAHAVQPVGCHPDRVFVHRTRPERNGVLKVCEELGIGFVPWGPVGMGYLTGWMTPKTRFDRRRISATSSPASRPRISGPICRSSNRVPEGG